MKGDTGPASEAMLRNKDENKAEALAQMEGALQDSGQKERPLQLPFTDAEFVCYMNGRKFSFVRNGDLEVTFTVPWQWRDAALPLHHAFGIPLRVTVERWHPSTDRQTP